MAKTETLTTQHEEGKRGTAVKTGVRGKEGLLNVLPETYQISRHRGVITDHEERVRVRENVSKILKLVL